MKDMMELKNRFQEEFAIHHDFEMRPIYGENLSTIRAIVIKMKNQPEFVIKSVCSTAYELWDLADWISTRFPKMIYKGETQTRFTEKLRHCVLSNRYDIPE